MRTPLFPIILLLACSIHLTCDEDCAECTDSSVANIDISGFWKRSVAHVVPYTFTTPMSASWLDWDNDGSNETLDYHYYREITKTTNRNYVKITAVTFDPIPTTGTINPGTYYCSSRDDTITSKGNTVTFAGSLTTDATLANNGNTLILVWKGVVSGEDYIEIMQKADKSEVSGAIDGQYCDPMDEL